MEHEFEYILPKPPSGFTWVKATEIGAAFLKPKGWYFKKHKQNETQGYFISKQNIDKKGYFITGVSILMIPDIFQKANMPPSEYAFRYIQALETSNIVIKQPWQYTNGSLDSYGVVLYCTEPDKGDFNSHHLAVGNDQTGTLYKVIFEAPTATWKKQWKYGEQILSKLCFDMEF